LSAAVERAEEGPEGSVRAPREYEVVDRRTIVVAGLALLIGVAGGLVAQALVALISLATNISFYGRISTAFVSPAGSHRGALALLVIPVIGAIIVGLMARFGSSSIRGHGIPEVMEKVLRGESRIPARVMFLKPIGRDRDRHRRAFRSGGPDHSHWWGARLSRRAVAACYGR
jgi:H+/Cl- antiporter ClcA